MMQKDLLGQDIFLIGRPSPLRRTLAMQYLELTGRELEYVALSRDTTESDLKQRREIVGGTAYYIDQSAVKAASEGRILVLEGIEKVSMMTDSPSFSPIRYLAENMKIYILKFYFRPTVI